MSRTAPDNRATSPCRPHLPLRPLWLCRVCAAPWPCPVARLTLRQEYAHDRVGLSVYPEAAALFTRFLGWARPRDTR